MSGFYEWKEKEKFFFSNNEVLYVACFYRIHKKETGFETESILLTTAANESVERVHDRKNEAIVILNNYFKGGVGKSKLSTMFAYVQLPFLSTSPLGLYFRCCEKPSVEIFLFL